MRQKEQENCISVNQEHEQTFSMNKMELRAKVSLSFFHAIPNSIYSSFIDFCDILPFIYAIIDTAHHV